MITSNFGGETWILIINAYYSTYLINNETIFLIFWPSQWQNSNPQRIVAKHQPFQ